MIIVTLFVYCSLVRLVPYIRRRALIYSTFYEYVHSSCSGELELVMSILKNKLSKNKIRNKCKAVETVNPSLVWSLVKFNSLARNGSSESLNMCRLAISLSWRLNGHEKIDELIINTFNCWRSFTKALDKDHVMWRWLWRLGHVFQRSWHTFRLNDSATIGLRDPINDFFCGAVGLGK